MEYLLGDCPLILASDEDQSKENLLNEIATCASLDSKIVFLSGRGETASIANRLASWVDGFPGAGRLEVGRTSISETRKIASSPAMRCAELLVSVGAGKVIDAGKILATRLAIPHIVFATALSSDALISSSTTLVDDAGGAKHRFAVELPVAVLVDTSITLKSPPVLTYSGLFDVLSNASALLDLKLSAKVGVARRNDDAIRYSEQAHRLATTLDPGRLCTHEGHELLAQALMLSGRAMQKSGTSEPCSGGEHSISHAIDLLNLGSGTHGIQVGAATLFCHALRSLMSLDALPREVEQVLRANLRAYIHPKNFGLDKPMFLSAVELATGIQPNRYTVLNEAPTDLFPLAYDFAFGEERDF